MDAMVLLREMRMEGGANAEREHEGSSSRKFLIGCLWLITNETKHVLTEVAKQFHKHRYCTNNTLTCVILRINGTAHYHSHVHGVKPWPLVSRTAEIRPALGMRRAEGLLCPLTGSRDW